MRKTVLAFFISISAVMAAPIHTTAENGDIAALKKELGSGVDINLQNEKFGQTPLVLAVYNEHYEMVEFLLSNGADANIKMSNGQTAIFIAAYLGENKTILTLLRHGALLNLSDKEGNTPLHRAAEGGSASAVALLLQNGAKVDALNKHRSTPLHRAAQYNNEDAVWSLVKGGASNTIVNDEEMRPSDVADEEDYGRIAKIIEKYAK